MISLMLACFRSDPAVTVRVWAPWEGASAAQIEAGLTEPLEESLGGLSGAHRLIGESWPGMARVTVTMPPGSATGVAAALDQVALPAGAGRPWADTLPSEVSEWLVPAAVAEEQVRELTEAFGLGVAWCDTCVTPVVEVVLPPGTEGVVDQLRGEWDTADHLLDAPLADGPPLRARATVIRALPARSSARWNMAPVALLHVARPASEVASWWANRPTVSAVRVPAENATYLELWGADPGSVEATLHALEASDALVLVRRPFPGGGPEPGRVEVIARWRDEVPDLSALGPMVSFAGPRPVVSGTPDQLAALGPPPRTTWDVEVDPDRAAAFALDAARVAAAVRSATVGHRFVARDRTTIEVRVGEASSAEAVAALVIGERSGSPVRVRDVGTVETVPTERYRLRYDGEAAAIGPGRDMEVIGELGGSRLSW